MSLLKIVIVLLLLAGAFALGWVCRGWSEASKPSAPAPSEQTGSDTTATDTTATATTASATDPAKPAGTAPMGTQPTGTAPRPVAARSVSEPQPSTAPETSRPVTAVERAAMRAVRQDADDKLRDGITGSRWELGEETLTLAPYGEIRVGDEAKSGSSWRVEDSKLVLKHEGASVTTPIVDGSPVTDGTPLRKAK